MTMLLKLDKSEDLTTMKDMKCIKSQIYNKNSITNKNANHFSLLTD